MCGARDWQVGGKYWFSGITQEQEQGGEQSRMRTLGSEELLRQLPVLQRLLGRLVECRPTGSASLDPVIQVLYIFG